MPRVLSRAVAAVLCLVSSAVLAAPTLSGGPRFFHDGTSRTAAFSGHRSHYAVKADVGATRGDLSGALVFHDARTGAVPDRPLGTLTLRFHESGTTRLGAGTRTIAFEPIGWTEARTDGALRSDVAVFTLAHNVFAVVVGVAGVTAPLTVEARLEAVQTDVSGTATAATQSVDLTLDAGESRPFGLTLASVADSTVTATSGNAYTATVATTLGASGTAAFVLAFGPASTTGALATSAIGASGAPSTWLASARESWDGHYATFAPPQDDDAARRAADRVAVATLWHNEQGPSATELWGASPAKTAYEWFEVRDVAFHALATTNRDAQGALSLLEGATHRRRYGEAGRYPRFGITGVTDDTSELPAFGWVARALVDRHPLTTEQKRSVYTRLRDTAAWWRLHRDRDGDTVPELNGGFESGAPASPRFSDLWQVRPEYPVEDLDPRPRLNAPDLSASLWHQYVEASRLAPDVGSEDEGLELLRRANYLAEAIEDPTLGHWNETDALYADYVLRSSSTRELRTIHTPASWWPLVVGVARNPLRVKQVVARMQDPEQFATPHGVTSVVRATSQGFAADAPWSGAISPEQQWLSVIALYRYGYEAEAEALRVQLLDRITSEASPREHYRADTGAGLGVSGFDTSAAVFVEALRNRHQAETFMVSRGGNAKERTGAIRRMFNLNGFLYYEVVVPESMEVPVTRMTAAAAILRDEPTVIELSDPRGLLGAREFTLRFPRFSALSFVRIREGAREEAALEDTTGEGVSLTAKVGDRIELHDLRYPGEGCGCGQAGGAGPLAVALGLLVALRAGAGRRRNPGRQASR